MAPRLKVFSWSDGFHAFTVAATSRDKALAAWGVEGDLFKTGLAREVLPGEPGYEDAVQTPGEVVRTDLKPKVGKAPNAVKRSKDEARRARVKADIRAVEGELKTIEAGFAKDREAIATKRARLDAEAEALDRREVDARAPLDERLAALRSKL